MLISEVLRSVERLERTQRGERLQKRSDRVGTADKPLTEVFLKDPRTGAVARLEYDSEAGDVRLVKER